MGNREEVGGTLSILREVVLIMMEITLVYLKCAETVVTNLDLHVTSTLTRAQRPSD